MSLLHHALTAQSRGLWIFPVQPMGKTPHPAAGQWGLTATNDRARIEYFWTRIEPRANIGVACKPSQLLVVDLDIPKEPNKLNGTQWAYMHGAYGPMVTGVDLWDEMAFKLGTNGPQGPHTYAVRTGSGGLHLYYRWPSFWPKTSQSSPAKGVIDVRGNGGQYGGYVLGEGSVTAAGRYECQHLSAPTLPPDWIRHLFTEKPPPPKPARPTGPLGIRLPGGSHSGLVETVRNAGEGNRNMALHWAARTMCEEGATERQAQDTLGPAAREAGLPHQEIERTIQSAYRTQNQKR